MNKDDFKWLILPGNPIIHRGMLSKSCVEHGRGSFQACVDQHLSMEVDLMMLKDQTVVVWRDEIVDTTGRPLSSLSLPEIRAIAQDNPTSRFGQLMTLNEFISLVDGKSGVVFEIKIPYGESPDLMVDSVLSILSVYRGNFVIHSSNPYVLHRIRTVCPDIPIGQISLSFKWIPNVDPEYVRLHREFLFADIVMPDFLDYDIRDLAEEGTRNRVLTFCREHELPLVTWAIRTAKEEAIARKYCSNYIIEGTTSFMD